MAYEVTGTGVKLTVATDVACHLWMRWSHTPWDVHLHSELVRGTRFATKPYYCLVAYEDNEQAEAGDTLTHTFTKEPWASCETRYFYFWGEIGGQPSPSESCLLKYHRIAPPWGAPVTVRYYSDPHPETTSVDGVVGQLTPNSTWAFLRNGPGNAVDSEAGTMGLGYLSAAGANEWWGLYRVIQLFNTLALPAVCLINSAKMAHKTWGVWNNLGGDPGYNIVSSNPASNITLIASDYTTLGSVEFSTKILQSTMSAGTWEEFAFNQAGLDHIAKAGISKFGIREVNYDLPNIPPPWGAPKTYNYWYPYSIEAVVANRPYLEVTYQPAL